MPAHALQVQSITKCMRAYLDTIDGIDRRLPLWVGFTGVENHCCNIFTIVSGCCTMCCWPVP